MVHSHTLLQTSTSIYMSLFQTESKTGKHTNWMMGKLNKYMRKLSGEKYKQEPCKSPTCFSLRRLNMKQLKRNYRNILHSWLNLTCVSSPAEGFVLPEDSADGVLIVRQSHRSLISKPLLVVSHEGAMADLCTWGNTQQRRDTQKHLLGFWYSSTTF